MNSLSLPSFLRPSTTGTLLSPRVMKRLALISSSIAGMSNTTTQSRSLRIMPARSVAFSEL
ncbi:hypothetical protein D3C85_1628480 [compost metagenome]